MGAAQVSTYAGLQWSDKRGNPLGTANDLARQLWGFNLAHWKVDVRCTHPSPTTCRAHASAGYDGDPPKYEIVAEVDCSDVRRQVESGRIYEEHYKIEAEDRATRALYDKLRAALAERQGGAR